MIKEAIILAGGLGTRLKGVISEIPKPMAPISKTPFLQYLFEYLLKYGINNVTLAVGFKSEVIENYFGDQYKTLKITYAFEKEPLGTGGGIANAIEHIKESACFLINGDTYFDVNLNNLFEVHHNNNSDLTLSLKEMINFDRYGTVETNYKNKIINFLEKQPLKKGYINGGVYIITKGLFLNFKKGEKFSFEKDIMETRLNETQVFAYKTDSYFIDIGIPEDYKKATTELPKLFSF